MSQLVTTVGRLESQVKLPSPTEKNPMHVSVVTLPSGKELAETLTKCCVHNNGSQEKD